MKIKRRKFPEIKEEEISFVRRNKTKVQRNRPAAKRLGGCMPYPPEHCDRVVEVKGVPYADIVQCEFFCMKMCEEYFDYCKSSKRKHRMQVASDRAKRVRKGE